MKKFGQILTATVLCITIILSSLLMGVVTVGADAIIPVANGFELASPDGDYNNFLLLDTLISDNGKKLFGIVSRNALYGWGYNTYAFVDQIGDGYPQSTETLKYISIKIPTTGSSIDSFSFNGRFPKDIRDYMQTHDWDMGVANNITYRYYGKVFLPTIEQLQANYQSLDIPLQSAGNYTQDRTLSRSMAYYTGLYLKLCKNDGAVANVQYPGSNTAFHLMTYVSEDFFKNIKLANMGSDVKAALANNFYRSDLTGIYTPAELDGIGMLASAKRIEGNTVDIGGKTYILSDTVVTTSDNKKAFGLISTQMKTAAWPNDANMRWSDDVENTTDTKIYKNLLYSGNQNIQGFKDTYFPNGELQSYMINYDWNLGTLNGMAHYVKGYVGLISYNEAQKYYKTNDLSVVTNGTFLMTRDSYYYSPTYGYVRYNTVTDARSNQAYTNGGGGVWYFMCYVPEDYFLENKIFVKTMKDGVKKVLADNLGYDKLSTVYSPTELALIFGTSQNTDRDFNVYCKKTFNGAGGALSGSTRIDATVAICNNSGSVLANSIIALAVTNESKELIGIIFTNEIENLQDDYINVPETLTLDNLEGVTEGCTVKVMIWENLETLRPLFVVQ